MRTVVFAVKMTCLTCLLLAGDGDTGVRTAHTNGILCLDPKAVSFALLQIGDMGVIIAHSLKGDPISLTLFLILHNEASDFTSTSAVRPLPFQPDFCLLCISVVQVLGWTRRI